MNKKFWYRLGWISIIIAGSLLAEKVPEYWRYSVGFYTATVALGMALASDCND